MPNWVSALALTAIAVDPGLGAEADALLGRGEGEDRRRAEQQAADVGPGVNVGPMANWSTWPNQPQIGCASVGCSAAAT